MAHTNIDGLPFDAEMIYQNSDNPGTAEMPLLKPHTCQNTFYHRISLAHFPDTHSASQNQLKTKTDNFGTVLFAWNTK